jgi:hypothetical protein
MQLTKILAKQQKAIVKKWFDVVVDSYPADTARMLKTQKDPFDNPVGSATVTGLRGLYDLLQTRQIFGEKEASQMHLFLDPIIRIRAVQAFTPAHATGFVFGLKKIIRDHVSDKDDLKALFRLDANIDTMALAAFDIYMRCRETLYEIKANETRQSTYRAFDRAGLLVGQDNADQDNADKEGLNG